MAARQYEAELWWGVPEQEVEAVQDLWLIEFVDVVHHEDDRPIPPGDRLDDLIDEAHRRSAVRRWGSR